MKYIKQLGIILFMALIGEILHTILPFPIPSSIYGMILLFISLSIGVVKETDVKDVSDFLIAAMGLFLLPSSISIMDRFSDMATLLPVLVIVGVLGTSIVMIVTGIVAQFIMNNKEGK